MNVLVFGKGKIYYEFYSALLSNCFVDFYDPRLNLFNKQSNYDLIIVCSSTEYHFDNLNYILNENISYKKIIVEKPLVKDLSEYESLQNTFDLMDLFTLTPFRLTSFYNFIKMHKDEVVKLNLDYGVLSKWNNASSNLSIYDSCLYDLGPHIFDTLFSVFTDSNVNILSKFLDFNNFTCEFTLNEIILNLSVSRSKYKSNVVEVFLKNGDIVKFSLQNSNFLSATNNNYSLNDYFPVVTSAYKELENIINNRSSDLFSSSIEFKEVISFIRSLDE